MHLEMLVNKFWNAIMDAKEENRFRGLLPFNRFPDDCCEHASDLLCQYLLENGIETYLVNGICRKDSQWHHVWLETDDGIVIDITTEQFIGKLVAEDEAEAVHVGGEGTVHRLFCVDRVIEKRTIFTDPNEFTDFGGRPNPYQKRLIELDEIIREYL